MSLIATLLAAIVITPVAAPHIDWDALTLDQQMALIDVWRPDPPERVQVFLPSFSTLPPAPVGEPWFQPLIETYFKVEDYEWAARVSLCESGWKADAINHEGSGAAGLFQMMPGWYNGTWGYHPFDPYNPEENVAAAAWLYYTGGPQNWVCK